MQSCCQSSVLPTPFRHVSQKTHSVTDNVRSASSTARSDEHALRPVIIGLIGGVASGKSTAASHLSSLGALWLDSDKAAREVLHWPEVIQQLRSQFGDEVIDSQGLPDRKAIAARVFGDDEPQIRQRRWLEQLIHPRVRQLTEQRIVDAGDTYPAILIDAPLLLEAGWGPRCDRILMIDTPESNRMQRAMERGWSAEEFRKREQSQLSIDQKRNSASDIIRNDGTVQQLYERLNEFWRGLPLPSSQGSRRDQ